MSELNPEAAEFRPFGDSELESCLEEGFGDLIKATRTCNTFPIGASYNLFQTYADFNVVTSHLRNNVVFLSNKIMRGEPLNTALKCEDDDESNQERVSACNYGMLDRVAGPTGAPPHASAAPVPAAWNRSSVLATVQVQTGGASLLGAKNITRPQLSFREPVDNSDKMFVPRISDKPNALRPLALTITYGPDKQPTGYEHPYAEELQQWVPPAWALSRAEPELPARSFAETPCTMVETRAALDALLAHLDTVREIAVDLEHHSYRSYQGLTCLVQISTDAGGDFIVDALALREHLHLLNNAFTHPDKIKVFHGADQDVLWLQRDFGVYVVGLFDTHQAARALRLPHASLKYLLERYCGVIADKSLRLADWRMRPLLEELIQYARSDTHYLLRVWRRMRAELTPHALLDVFRNSQRVASSTYCKPTLTADAHAALYARSGKRWGAAQLAALRAVWAWRDGHARALDESPAYLLPNHMVLAVCEAMPRDLQGLRALTSPPPPFLLHHMHDLHQIILACRCVPEAAAAFHMPAAVRAMSAAASATRAAPNHDLLAVPDAPHTSTPASGVEGGARSPCAPDVPAFRASTHPPQRSQVNAAAAAFLPPYHRYRVYRLSAQAEEEAALRARRARAEALGRGSEAVRDAVLLPLDAAIKHEPGPELEPEVDVEKRPVHVFCAPPASNRQHRDEVTPAVKPEHVEDSRLVHAESSPPSPRKRKHRSEAGQDPYAGARYARLRTDKPPKHRKAK